MLDLETIKYRHENFLDLDHKQISDLIAEIERLRAELAWCDDMDKASSDRLLQLAWLNQTMPGREHWEYEIGFAHNTAGGWHHGRAEYWRPITPPQEKKPAFNAQEPTNE